MSLRSKKHAQRHHAKQRALQRYGWQFNRHDLNLLAKRIQRGDARFVEKQSNRVTVWDIDINGETARVVYDKLRGQIVTFLPKECVHAETGSLQDSSEVSGETKAALSL